MFLWRVDLIDDTPSTLGTVAAADERSALIKAAILFRITPARRRKLVVTKIEVPGGMQTKAPNRWAAGAEVQFMHTFSSQEAS